MERLKHIAKLALAATATLAAVATWAGDAKEAKPKPYPLSTCVVSGEKLGGSMGDPYVFTCEGREIKLCCKSCLDDFKKDQAKFLAKVDAAAKAVKPYPLTTCVVSGEKLDGMGDAYAFIHEGREIKLCCKDCLKEFNKDTAKYLKKLDQAAKASKAGSK